MGLVGAKSVNRGPSLELPREIPGCNMQDSAEKCVRLWGEVCFGAGF